MEATDILVRKNLGAWKPDYELSNLAIMHYESPEYGHRRLFPVCPVQLPAGKFWEFRKEDLARPAAQIKPPYGKVAPMVFGFNELDFSCKVYQINIGVDLLMNLPFERADSAIDPRRLRVPTIIEQIALTQEIIFAKNFFNPNAWGNAWTGAANADIPNKKFKKFSAANSDPIGFFDDLATEIQRNGRRKPNKLALGVETFKSLKNHPTILERVKYSGATSSPAVVNENILAQILGLEQVVVLDSTYNAAGLGATADLQFVNNPKDALLLYTPDAPSITTPSAGYNFTWLIDGANYISVSEHEGDGLTHTNFLEGLIAFDMRKTCDALAVYCSNCV